TPLEITEL
nr:Chain B, octameric peptide from Cadherin-23 [Homo sapiens]